MPKSFIEQPFTYDDVEILEVQTLYQGFLELRRYRLRFRLFAGGYSGIITRELMLRRPCVALLPYDPKRDQVLLIEQFRVGAIHGEATSPTPWLLEVVAGIIDAGEMPEAAIRREALEEAGLTIHELIPIQDYWVSPGASTEKMTLFCGLTDLSQPGGIFGALHEHEDIKTHVLSAREAFDLTVRGQIKNAPSLIALQWLELQHDRLNKKR
jgi:ADP-ribose pyrophosphatase